MSEALRELDRLPAERLESGVACHTGRQARFYRRLENGDWRAADPALREPAEMYPTGGGS